MTTKEDEDKDLLPRFKATKEDYPTFIMRFKAYASKKKCVKVIGKDPGKDLVTTEEYAEEEREVEDPSNQGSMTTRRLTQQEIALYDQNSTLFNKLVSCVDDNTMIAIHNAAGPNNSMWNGQCVLQKS